MRQKLKAADPGTGPPLEIADPAKIGPVRIGELAFHDPKFRLNPAALTEAQRATMAANAATQALYGGEYKNYDPKLRRAPAPGHRPGAGDRR